MRTPQHDSTQDPLGSTLARLAPESVRESVKGRKMSGRRGGVRGMLRPAALVALLGCLGLLAAGCGGGSTTTSAASGGGPAELTQQQEVSIDVAYAGCLNKHGVQVEAVRTGGLAWMTGPGVPARNSPQDLNAQRDCKSVLPKGGLPRGPTQAQTEENLLIMLRYAKCIRAHGVPNFPDPTSLGLRISPSSGINLNSPAFLTAEKRCARDSLTIGGGF
jgi:hypothetical protein